MLLLISCASHKEKTDIPQRIINKTIFVVETENCKTKVDGYFDGRQFLRPTDFDIWLHVSYFVTQPSLVCLGNTGIVLLFLTNLHWLAIEIGVLRKSGFSRSLYSHFMHPSSRNIFILLKRVRSEFLDSILLKILEQITQPCGVCSEFATGLLRLNAFISMHEFIFNHAFVIDLMWLSVWMSGIHTSFKNATFLCDKISISMWHSFVECRDRENKILYIINSIN